MRQGLGLAVTKTLSSITVLITGLMTRGTLGVDTRPQSSTGRQLRIPAVTTAVATRDEGDPFSLVHFGGRHVRLREHNRFANRRA